MLPGGDDGPGALEARAHRYVETLLRDGLAPAVHTCLVEGLDLIDAMAKERHGRPYADCTGEVREELLRQVAEIPHPLPRRFVRHLVHLTLRGLLCDPSHGGNHDRLGWRLIGFEPVPGGGS